MNPRPLPSRRDAILLCLFAAFTAISSAGLLSAAALVPAPPAVLPFVAVVCIGSPMAAAYELPAAIAGLRAGRRARELEALRRQIDELPETEHPLGL